MQEKTDILTNIKQKTINGFIWEFSGTGLSMVATFAISIVLARLLDPADFGMVGMALVFILIFETLADLGFSNALIQNKNTNEITFSSVFVLNMIIGVTLCLVFYFISPAIGSFYNNVIIADLVRVLSILFILNALCMVPIAWLKRNLKFKELNARLLISNILGGVVGVWMAFNGYGVYSLVGKMLVTSTSNVLLFWVNSWWRPSLQFAWEEVKKISEFSTYMFFSNITHSLIRQADTLIIGKLFSPAILGFFSRADSLNGMVRRLTSGTLAKVFFPVLSKMQNQKDRSNLVFIRLLTLVSFVTFLLSGILMTSGETIILGLFGDKWAPSVEIFQILMLVMINAPINAMIVNYFLAKGMAKENFWLGNIRKILLMIPWILAFTYGFKAYLYAIIVVSYLNLIFNLISSSYYLGLEFRLQIKSVWRFLIFFLLALVVTQAIPSGGFAFVFLRLLTFVSIYILLSALLATNVFKEIQGIWLSYKLSAYPKKG